MDSLEQKIENFLTNIIKAEDWKNVKENHVPSEKLEFLRKIVKNHVNTVYFQNISMTIVETEKRHGPSLEEVIEVGSKGSGGVCIQMNYFLKLTLDYLGYDAFAIAAHVTVSPVPDNHCCIVVKFGENEMYLVDVACGTPNDEPIPLHKLPYRTMAAGYPFEYRRTEEGIIQRVHLKGSYTNGDFLDADKEEIRYTFSLEPKSFSTFDSPMQEIFTDPEKPIFLKTTYVFRHFLKKNVPDETDYNFILVLGSTVVIGGRDTRQVTKYSSIEEIIPILIEYFPKLIPSEIEKAVKIWKEYGKENQDLDLNSEFKNPPFKQ